MEMSMAWSVRTLLVTLATIQILTFVSEGSLVDGSALERDIDPGTTRWISDPMLHGQESIARGWNPYRQYAIEDADGLAKTSGGNPENTGNPRATSSRQLKQASPSAEAEALMAFKVGITSDPHGVLTSWNSNDSDPCHWIGVTCSQGSNRIIALELDNLLLTGTISPLLGSLTFLQQLNLSANSFHGEIPHSLLNCSHLTYLALRDNNLDGTVPSELGNLRYLQYLDLSNNLHLGGNIPASIGNCSDLRLLHLDYTIVDGEIPPSIGQLAHLESLNLSCTFNNGTIPRSLGNCSALTYLYIGNLYTVDAQEINGTVTGLPPSTFLSGQLPAELGQLIHLTGLGIAGTNIGGVFPSWIANFTALTGVLLVDSFFTGEIPDFLGRLPLEILALSEANFTGSIPDSITNCSNLWFLAIEVNPYLTGVIPPGLGLLRKLGALSFILNNLTGIIPSSMSNCSRMRNLGLDGNFFDPQLIPTWVSSFVNLTLLSLSSMGLVGDIHATLGEISKLDTLYLGYNQLSGAIPASLGNCTSLKLLQLQHNGLTGQVPPEIWNLQKLMYFWMEQNFLTGDLPESIGNWSQVQQIFVDRNLFHGKIPSQIGVHKTLQNIDFSLNNFTGPIPLSIGNCSALTYVDLSQNQLTGSLPSSLGNLSGLQTFRVYNNHLEGAIPGDLMRCTGLGSLDLSHNLLVNSVPEEIGQLVSLETLSLHHNQLSGAIPHSLSSCRNLVYVDLSFNKLNGSIAGDAIANSSASLSIFNVSQNFLSGSLPDELGMLTLVSYFNFSGNNFSGSIPSSLGSCTALESLDVSMNNLSGAIPQALGHLPALRFVNVSYNHLEGPLPDGGLFNSRNLSVAWFLGNPGMCGSIFLKECPAGISPTNVSDCKGFKCDRSAIVATSVGAVVALMIAGAITYRLLSKLLAGGGCFGRGSLEETHGVVQEDDFVMGFVLSDQDLVRVTSMPENIIGMGERSTVYREVLPGRRTIAIKVVTAEDVEGDGYRLAQVELQRVVHNLSSIRHRNIVKILGLKVTPKSTALLLEYMPKGSLQKQLYEVEECVLSWEARINIAVGVAEGLFYLHSQAHEPIIHRDLKPGNILLDEDLVPKLADFGISKFVKLKTKDRAETTVSKLCGTVGYIPPEYAVSMKVSTKGDVYSYGVVLLELLTRKHPVLAVNHDIRIEMGQPLGIHIVDWILEVAQSTPLAVLDPMLLENNNPRTNTTREANERSEQMKMLQVGLLCTQAEPKSRPTMGDVLAMLKQIQEKEVNLPHHPTVEELANEVSMWHTQDQEPRLNLESGY